MAASRDPDFLVIGAQRAGTTWLWTMLKQHPGTSLPEKKEIHYFGSAELYRNGRAWYDANFAGLDLRKVIGEGSTSYFYDRVPYFKNKSRLLEHDLSLPCIPALIARELPRAKILLMLRDPVSRAISSYLFWMQQAMDVSPFLGLRGAATGFPKMRILEYGDYARFLKVWQQHVPPERMRVMVFEEDVVKEPARTLRAVYEFLDLDPALVPAETQRVVNSSWTWTRILLDRTARQVSSRIARSRRVGRWVDRHDVLGRFAVRPEDIEFLRARYLPGKSELEAMLDRPLDCWRYGSHLLRRPGRGRIS